MKLLLLCRLPEGRRKWLGKTVSGEEGVSRSGFE